MEELVKIMLASGKTGLDLALYVLLPVLVIMMGIMKVVEARGILARVARLLQPLLRLFGIPGAGAFAIVQMLLVSWGSGADLGGQSLRLGRASGHRRGGSLHTDSRGAASADFLICGDLSPASLLLQGIIFNSPAK